MRESIIFLNIVLLTLVLAGRMTFQWYWLWTRWRREKTWRCLFMEEYGGFHFFCLTIFWQKYKNIAIAKVLYIIFSFKNLWPIFALVVYFFYIVKQGKNIFFYIKKYGKAHFFTLFGKREHIFPNCIWFCIFLVLFLGFHIIMDPS